ncbi:MAG TPA: redoxin domain-containing protein [Terracidiphilus sp.]|jgi:peroxiredoxin
MTFRSRIFIAVSSAALLPLVPAAQVKVGDPAPPFTATDSRGHTQKLEQYRGKYVVLEWHNQGCPFTRKHYSSGNMQNLQKEWTAKGIVWFTVISSAPGHDGYVTPDEENSYVNRMHAAPSAVLLDPKGDLGHKYSARTTPHMFVIDPQGKVIYEGAIDNRPTPDPADVNGAENYVSDALMASMAGKAVNPAYTRPYGCSVKYE